MYSKWQEKKSILKVMGHVKNAINVMCSDKIYKLHISVELVINLDSFGVIVFQISAVEISAFSLI